MNINSTQNSKLKTQNLTDYHCHILPGIDDGAATMDEAVEMAKALRQAGYATVYCTPHLIKGNFEADNATVRTALDSLQAELVRQQIDLRLLPGREYYLDEFLSDYLRDPMPLGETKYLLIEIPSHMPAEFVKETCYRIKCAGYIPMIAHPERCRLFQLPLPSRKGLRAFFDFGGKAEGRKSGPEKQSLLDYLKDLGCSFQGNLGSFAGWYGQAVRQEAERLRGEGLYSHYGSDLHSIRQKDILIDEWSGCPLAQTEESMPLFSRRGR